jgi:hypothetical protein
MSHHDSRVHRPGGRVTRVACLLACVMAACEAPPAADTVAEAEPAPDASAPILGALDTAFVRLRARAAAIDDALQPVPLLTPAQEQALRSDPNARQLERARSLGVRPTDATALDAARNDGRLIVLEDSTRYWVVRELDHSQPLVTPATRLLLERIGERFQARIAEHGLPAYRLDITSVLRTADDQTALRTTNPNAAAGVSTHEFGTSVDIAYSSFAAPIDPYGAPHSGPAALAPYLDRIAALVLETAAARKSRELQAILGSVLNELRREGDVLVTLERQQPVFHITLARHLP